MIELNKIYNEDCLEGMKRIPDESVDMVLSDLPYGTTQLKWDIRLPFDKLWEQWLRVCKTNAAIVLFSSQPFTTDLINSNRKIFKYEIIWDKVTKTNFYDAHKRPMKSHENILVFYQKQPTYNPIKYSIGHIDRKPRKNSDFAVTSGNFVGKVNTRKAEEYLYKVMERAFLAQLFKSPTGTAHCSVIPAGARNTQQQNLLNFLSI